MENKVEKEILENQRIILKALRFIVQHQGERVLVNLSEKYVVETSLDNRHSETINILSELESGSVK